MAAMAAAGSRAEVAAQHKATGHTGAPHQAAVHKAAAAKVRDLDEIRHSKTLRVLVNQSRNSSGEVDGKLIGVENVRLRAFETYLNGHAGPAQRIHIKLIPKPKEQLLAALQRGEGDLAAPGEGVDAVATLGLVASAATVEHAPLIVVGNKGERTFTRIEQLAGRTLALPAGSAAGEAIKAVNATLAQRRMRPVQVEWVDASLAVEDVLEMVQAGIYSYTAVEQPIAERWAKVMPNLRPLRKLSLDTPGHINWYTRASAPLLNATVDRFIAGYQAPPDQDTAFVKAYARLYKVHYPLASADRRRLEQLRPLLQRNARQQGMDWLNLAALAFKESALNPSARGAGGATGLLQITPAAAQRVGVGNIQEVDNNVQAGAKYLAMIQRKFFSSQKLNDRERMAFVLAAYNLGPERVQAMRVEARKRGLNPDRWFFQVERVAMEQVGMGPVSYVASVNKYFLAFDRERESLEPQGRKLAER
jgi:membrane-bound lytic murein transglycosylase MltF